MTSNVCLQMVQSFGMHYLALCTARADSIAATQRTRLRTLLPRWLPWHRRQPLPRHDAALRRHVFAAHLKAHHYALLGTAIHVTL